MTQRYTPSKPFQSIIVKPGSNLAIYRWQSKSAIIKDKLGFHTYTLEPGIKDQNVIFLIVLGIKLDIYQFFESRLQTWVHPATHWAPSFVPKISHFERT